MARGRPIDYDETVDGSESPCVIALAGPNGAGKATAGPSLVRDTLGMTQFVNADVVASGLSAFEPEGTAIRAGRIMLDRLRQLARDRKSFAFETTLSARSFAPWLARLNDSGYRFHLIYLWLPDPEMAVQRVAARVRAGGHGIPDETVRRRYTAGLANFFHIYCPLSSTWRMYDNSKAPPARLIASGGKDGSEAIVDRASWEQAQRGANDESA